MFISIHMVLKEIIGVINVYICKNIGHVVLNVYICTYGFERKKIGIFLGLLVYLEDINFY